MKLTSIVASLASVALTGCASTVGCRAGNQPCVTYGPVNDETPNGTSCALVVQNEHACTYDSEGRFKGEKIHPGRGVCVCLGFDD